MKFSEMEYKRPDINATVAFLNGEIEKFKNAQNADEAEKVLLGIYDELEDFETNMTLAFIRHSIDTTDEFYDGEREFMDNNMPIVSNCLVELSKAIAETKFRPELEKKYGKLMFVNAELETKTFSELILEDSAEENKLESEYAKLLASAQINFNGEICTLAQMTPFKQSNDDELRRKAWIAEGNFYIENAEKLDEIYDKMVRVRTKMGQKLGFDNYVGLGYCRLNRNCYTNDDVEKFRTAVKKYIVPVADKIARQQAERIGVSYPLSFADSTLKFRSGNPKPCGTSEQILENAKNMYHEMSDITGEFIDFMYDNELLDVLSRKGKEGGGYCTGISKYKSPFIFANFNGTQGDVEVMTHEAGHALAAYIAFKKGYISPLSSPTMESCECHSMSMEFFAGRRHAKEFFGDDAEKFLYLQPADAIMFIPYGTMVDNFQSIMYQNPKLTPAERHAVWRKLLGEYMPWMKLDDGIPFYGDAKGWQRQSHIYTSPFYYIDYCLAQIVSLEFWMLMQRDEKDAWNRYMEFVGFGGTKSFTELVEAVGLNNPFNEKDMKEVADFVDGWLDETDISGLK